MYFLSYRSKVWGDCKWSVNIFKVFLLPVGRDFLRELNRILLNLSFFRVLNLFLLPFPAASLIKDDFNFWNVFRAVRIFRLDNSVSPVSAKQKLGHRNAILLAQHFVSSTMVQLIQSCNMQLSDYNYFAPITCEKSDFIKRMGERGAGVMGVLEY
jgi:hypothetical protein